MTHSQGFLPQRLALEPLPMPYLYGNPIKQRLSGDSPCAYHKWGPRSGTWNGSARTAAGVAHPRGFELLTSPFGGQRSPAELWLLPGDAAGPAGDGPVQGVRDRAQRALHVSRGRTPAGDAY